MADDPDRLWRDALPRVDVNWSDIPDDRAKSKILTLSKLVMTVIEALVDNEMAVKVVARGNHRRVQFTVHVSGDDVGFAVGQGGRHADALRTLLIAACRKLKFHFDLDIVGPSGDIDWSSS
jgi:predicted RNA-binding protein YlqC (UPF0109 family)